MTADREVCFRQPVITEVHDRRSLRRKRQVASTQMSLQRYGCLSFLPPKAVHWFFGF